MGLDYEICVKITERSTNAVIKTFEIAYWRKCWALRTKTMNVARANPEKVIQFDTDWRLEVETSVLEDIIECLTTAVADRNDELHTDSIWGGPRARQITLRQLERLCLWDNLFARFEDILAEDKGPERLCYIDEIGDILDEIEQDEEYPSDFDISEILSNLENYKFTLEIINSY